MEKRIPLIAAISIVGSMALASQPKSIDRALAIAQQHVAATASHVSSFTLSTERCYPSSAILTDAHLTPGQEAFYVFYGQGNLTYDQSRQPGEGFVIVAADDRPSPILGYSPQGHFDPVNLPDNLKIWLEAYTHEQTSAPDPTKLHKAPAYSGWVEPFCYTFWGQGAPYNNLCPVVNGARSMTGCTATAMAQAINIYGYPSKAYGAIDYFTYTYNKRIQDDLSQYSFDWRHMLDEYLPDEYTQQEALAVAELMLACGESACMDYTPESSGAHFTNAIYGLYENFGYDEDMLYLEKCCMTDDEWHTVLMGELNAERPVIYSGATVKHDSHAFLMDGYTVKDNEPYYHINWGWQGMADGYYRIAYLKPEGTNDNYKMLQSCIVNIKPDDGKKEFSSFWMAEEAKVTPEVIDLDVDNSIKVELINFYNYSLNTFTGDVLFYLIGANGTYLIDRVTTKNIEFQYGWSSFPIPFKLKNVPAGDYELEVRTKPTISKYEERVPYGNSPVRVRITGNGAAQKANVQVADFEVIEYDGTNREVSARAHRVANFSDDSFDGYLSLAVAGTDKRMISTFGTPETTLGVLETYHLQRDPIDLQGTLPTSLTDGEYLLCLAACLKEGDWSMVRAYSTTGNQIETQDQECFIPCWLVDGRLTLIKPAQAIESVVADQLSISLSDGICTVSGLPDGSQVAVYDLAGRLIGSAFGSHGMAEIDVDGHNRIIVRTLGDGPALNQKVVVGK